MGVHLYKHKFSYMSVPKVACTSLKHFFFEIENGFPFSPYKTNGKHRDIHNAGYPSRVYEREVHPQMKDHWKVAVVRDPVDRLLSCYANRVLGYKCLSNIAISEEDREAGVVPDPDLKTFIGLFWRYRQISHEIYHHALPMVSYLGNDPKYYDVIYPISEVGRLAEDVAAKVGTVPALKRMQTSGTKIDRTMLNERQIEKVKRIFAKDYDIYGQFI